MKIVEGDLTGSEIVELLNKHLLDMQANTPPESIHALDIKALRKPEITFWSVWDGIELAGCGALKELDGHHAEIKSMRTASSHLRKGVAKSLLQHMFDISQQRKYEKLSLETGSGEDFLPARELYSSHGFDFCEPFAEYTNDPNSVFMTKQL